MVFFFFFSPFGDTSIFFLSFFGGFFLGGAYVGLCVGWGWGGVFWFFEFFLANYCAEDLIGCGTLPLAKFYFLFFFFNSFGCHFLF